MTSNAAVKFNLRLPIWMKKQLEDEAARNDRSLNQEICQRLRRSLQGYR
jgi:predicted HicB family RNase H-like nuclease